MLINARKIDIKTNIHDCIQQIRLKFLCYEFNDINIKESILEI